ncbi:TPA: hypothetical protein N0F65_009701 [Lagenidium giganteum]|uniref:Kinesin-like protein n=1 Tax=Lagenidium giganteum TaxID=4803 RepID=A0AAV2YCE5_9STRA|nr:TPA: hypothetical protein N0F65_009701 [Lagenidium giganteum]
MAHHDRRVPLRRATSEAWERHSSSLRRLSTMDRERLEAVELALARLQASGHRGSGIGRALGPPPPPPPLPLRRHGSWSAPPSAASAGSGRDASASPKPSEVHTIQVAVRCRPRKASGHNKRDDHGSRRWMDHDLVDESSDGEEVSDSVDDNDDSSEDSYAQAQAYRKLHGLVDFVVPGPQQQGKPCILLPSTLAHAYAVPSGGASENDGKRRFEFDYVFPPWKTQRCVYEESVESLMAHVLHESAEGVAAHATVVAYGQTGTGKTYTMGMLGSHGTQNELGVIPRACTQVFGFVQQYNQGQHGQGSDVEGTKLSVSMSFVQIYLEAIQDLLVVSTIPGSAPARKDLPVRQQQDGSFYVEGLQEYAIDSLEDVFVLLETAQRNRMLASTARNKTSSRSHTLMTLTIKPKVDPLRHLNNRGRARPLSSEHYDDTDEDECEDHIWMSTISFVDLAGSERVDGALDFLKAARKKQELRIREAKFINKSLSALGGVIAALARPQQRSSVRSQPSSRPVVVSRSRLRGSPKQRPSTSVRTELDSPHIRFRDSQLTKLLQARLRCGSGRLLLIATIDDRAENLNETLSTLKFAAQCRSVELQPRTRAQGDEGAQRRKDSLLQEVFDEMKISYEEREMALQRMYEDRIQALEEQLETQASKINMARSVEPSALQNASYLALCSLVDLLPPTPIGSSKRTAHPSIESFADEKQQLEYVATLYHRLKESIRSTTATNRSVETNKSAIIPTRTTSPEKKSIGISKIPSPMSSPLRSQLRTASSRSIDVRNDPEFQRIAAVLLMNTDKIMDLVSDDDEVAK